MQIPFVKYHGTGNDFILIDDRSGIFPIESSLIQAICDRHFGIGSDGIILLRNHPEYDFEMLFYNPDGSPAGFCGNGGRCIVAFAQSLEIIGMQTTFVAPDGLHTAEIIHEEGHIMNVRLQLRDAVVYEADGRDFYLNTGTYHYVRFVDQPDTIDILAEGQAIRYDHRFAPHGTNVNFARFDGHQLFVRTYEKGVENETLACGTGVVASAIAASMIYGIDHFRVIVKGGELSVSFTMDGNEFKKVFLEGPATRVFEGQYSY